MVFAAPSVNDESIVGQMEQQEVANPEHLDAFIKLRLIKKLLLG
jgi:hypothetical protein